MNDTKDTGLSRQLGLLGLAATGICSMLGAGINMIPFMIQRNVPDIGPNVMTAFVLGAVPAVLAALSYAVLASAMPRAGGSYVYVSRSLSPYLGFVASFSQWFGLSIAIGVVSYVTVPFLRDVADAVGMQAIASALETGGVRVTLALLFLWAFVGVNLLGLRFYERTLIPMMFVMFALGAIVIVAGFSFDHADFAASLLDREGRAIPNVTPSPFRLETFLAASAILFGSFIGFDAIAQAGGEARNPDRTLPLAILIAVGVVGSYYLLFTAAVYNAVPWQFVSHEAATKDITAPGMLGYLLSPGWTVAIVLGAAIALLNDLPAMLLANSRLMFAWAEDGVFPKAPARIHPKFRSPHIAVILSGMMASVGILGSHLAGDFFLGVDLLVTSMLVNFLLMCVSVLVLPKRNPELAKEVKTIRSRPIQLVLGSVGALTLGVYLSVHVYKDLSAGKGAWYYYSTPVWLTVMAIASVIFFTELRKLKASGADVKGIFSKLPEE